MMRGVVIVKIISYKIAFLAHTSIFKTDYVFFHQKLLQTLFQPQQSP